MVDTLTLNQGAAIEISFGSPKARVTAGLKAR